MHITRCEDIEISARIRGDIRPGGGRCAGAAFAHAPRLFDEVRRQSRLRHGSLRTGKASLEWICRFILLHGKREPQAVSGRGLGSVTRRGIYDNMKTAVDRTSRKDRDRVVNARFAAMAAHYLFGADFCIAASGWEKGRVEKGVRGTRRRIWFDAQQQRFGRSAERVERVVMRNLSVFLRPWQRTSLC